MFSISEQTATLAHINVRTERHGDEPAGAADLKINFTDGNGVLSEFHPVLRSFLYKQEESPDQGEMPVGDALTVRRFGDLIEKIRLKHELVGAKVLIGFGLGGASDIELDPADVDGFAAELMEGGSVVITFRVKCHPSGEQIKKLYEVLGNEITISITPAQEKQQSLGLDLEAA
ncbi:hypothetical protein LMG26685_02160 [Achromobacter mucicolens]|uniref:hypothetical protein n=1 Tax=Achromobacter mucicolens TaxID=1389922 RepID=UPI0009CF6724|nr:hypothetical protein [Achromobacter mucicolens]OXC91357.1 hypothetical protein BMR85_009600 [Achromobacter sp. KAs 3-5]CAB3643434.1 hypothetical protein LMG26685_02160 [Achromobacter mucicolens]